MTHYFDSPDRLAKCRALKEEQARQRAERRRSRGWWLVFVWWF